MYKKNMNFLLKYKHILYKLFIDMSNKNIELLNTYAINQ